MKTLNSYLFLFLILSILIASFHIERLSAMKSLKAKWNNAKGRINEELSKEKLEDYAERLIDFVTAQTLAEKINEEEDGGSKKIIDQLLELWNHPDLQKIPALKVIVNQQKFSPSFDDADAPSVYKVLEAYDLAKTAANQDNAAQAWLELTNSGPIPIEKLKKQLGVLQETVKTAAINLKKKGPRLYLAHAKAIAKHIDSHTDQEMIHRGFDVILALVAISLSALTYFGSLSFYPSFAAMIYLPFVMVSSRLASWLNLLVLLGASILAVGFRWLDCINDIQFAYIQFVSVALFLFSVVVLFAFKLGGWAHIKKGIYLTDLGAAVLFSLLFYSLQAPITDFFHGMVHHYLPILTKTVANNPDKVNPNPNETPGATDPDQGHQPGSPPVSETPSPSIDNQDVNPPVPSPVGAVDPPSGTEAPTADPDASEASTSPSTTNTTVAEAPKENETGSAFGLGVHASVVVCANALVFSVLCLF